ncbi:hypothetical protein [Streptococcus marmotae]|nr:hypothetical protein [Streptococcus marmotae]
MNRKIKVTKDELFELQLDWYITQNEEQWPFPMENYEIIKEKGETKI